MTTRKSDKEDELRSMSVEGLTADDVEMTIDLGPGIIQTRALPDGEWSKPVAVKSFKMSLEKPEDVPAHHTEMLLTGQTFELTAHVTDVVVYERDFEIWASGYRATGEHAYAHKLAVARALTFDDAVAKHVASLAPKDRTFYKRHPDGRWSHWSCWLYDNEAEARKAYG